MRTSKVVQFVLLTCRRFELRNTKGSPCRKRQCLELTIASHVTKSVINPNRTVNVSLIKQFRSTPPNWYRFHKIRLFQVYGFTCVLTQMSDVYKTKWNDESLSRSSVDAYWSKIEETLIVNILHSIYTAQTLVTSKPNNIFRIIHHHTLMVYTTFHLYHLLKCDVTWLHRFHSFCLSFGCWNSLFAAHPNIPTNAT